MEKDDRIKEAIERTEILRAPKQSLYTFGTTSIFYYLVTEPAYSELVKDTAETVIREGRVIAERPKIVTPYYLNNLEGFSPEARRYFRALLEEHGSDARGLYYTYRNEPKGFNIVSDNIRADDIQLVGRYALHFRWSDGHSTGIYSFETLRQICPCPQCQTGVI